MTSDLLALIKTTLRQWETTQTSQSDESSIIKDLFLRKRLRITNVRKNDETVDCVYELDQVVEII